MRERERDRETETARQRETERDREGGRERERDRDREGGMEGGREGGGGREGEKEREGGREGERERTSRDEVTADNGRSCRDMSLIHPHLSLHLSIAFLGSFCVYKVHLFAFIIGRLTVYVSQKPDSGTHTTGRDTNVRLSLSTAVCF